MKNQRTNSTHVKNLIKEHISNSVYDINENQFLNFADSAKELNTEFKRTADHAHNLRKFPNNSARFDDYLRGLPYHFLIYDAEIEDFLNSLGINNEGKEYPADKMRSLYANLIYREIQNF